MPSRLERCVAAQARELAGQTRGVGVLEQTLAGAFGGDVRGLGQEPIEVPVLEDELRRALLPDPLHAGNVVARVADEGSQVEQLGRPDAEALFDGRLVDASPLHRVEQLDAGPHELHQVLVRRDDADLGLAGRRLDQRRDHVVGLEARHDEPRYAERRADLRDERELRREILGLLVAPRLVLGIELVPEAAAGRIHGDDDVGRPFLAQDLREHRREAVGRVGRGSVGSAEVRDGEEGAVDRVRPVDDDEAPRRAARRLRGMGRHGAMVSRAAGYAVRISRAGSGALSSIRVGSTRIPRITVSIAWV